MAELPAPPFAWYAALTRSHPPDPTKTEGEINACENLTAEVRETPDSEPGTKRTKCELDGGDARDGQSRAGSAAE